MYFSIFDVSTHPEIIFFYNFSDKENCSVLNYSTLDNINFSAINGDSSPLVNLEDLIPADLGQPDPKKRKTDEKTKLQKVLDGLQDLWNEFHLLNTPSEQNVILLPLSSKSYEIIKCTCCEKSVYLSKSQRGVPSCYNMRRHLEKDQPKTPTSPPESMNED